MSEAPGGAGGDRGGTGGGGGPRYWSPAPPPAPPRLQGVGEAALGGGVATFPQTATLSGPQSRQERAPRGWGWRLGRSRTREDWTEPTRRRAARRGKRQPHVAHAPRPERASEEPARAYPVGGGDANDELDGLLHVEPAVPAHHQSGLLPLRRLHGGDDTLDEILRVVGAALEHLHPLPQPARARFLVRVGLGLNCHDLHHVGDLLPGAGATSAHRGAAGALAAAVRG